MAAKIRVHPVGRDRTRRPGATLGDTTLGDTTLGDRILIESAVFLDQSLCGDACTVQLDAGRQCLRTRCHFGLQTFT